MAYNNAKNLCYGMLVYLFLSPNILTATLEPKEPAFLRRLRNQHGGGESARHECPLPRQSRHQAEDNNEDLPIYLDVESHNTISKAEYDALFTQAGKMRVETDALPASLLTPHGAGMDVVSEVEKSDHVVQVKQAEASIGAGLKRKLAKVITEGHEDGDSLLPFKRIAPIKKRKKKLQDVKLSFDDS